MNGTANTEVEPSADNVNSANAGTRTETMQNEEPYYVTVKNFIVSFPKLVTVEPYLVFYYVGITFTFIPLKSFYLEKACRAELNFTKDICQEFVFNPGNDTLIKEISQNASIIVGNLISWKDSAQTGIPAIFILFIAAWSDRTGNRKMLLLLPMLGEFFSVLVWIIGVYYMAEWPLWFIGVLEVTASVCTGGFPVALMGCYCYVADVTTPETRTFRIGVLFFIVRVAGLIGIPFAGFLYSIIGTYGVFGCAMGFYAIGLIYTLLKIKDVRSTETEGTLCEKLCLFFNPKNIWDTISIVFTSRGIQLAQILLIILVHMLMVGPAAGEGSVGQIYVLNKFNMAAKEYSLYFTFSSLSGILGLMIGVTVFSKWLKFHDTVLGLIATTSNVIASLTYGFAPTKAWYYAGAAFDVFGSAGGPAVRSMGTKVVEPNQIGKICSLIGLVDSLASPIFIPLFNQVLNKYIKTFPGAVYMLGAGVTTPDFIIFIVLYILHKRQQKDVVRSPEVKEMHVYDNDVTVF